MILRIKVTILFVITYLFSQSALSQKEETVKNIFNEALTNGQAYTWLDYLSNQIGGRLSGSPEAAAAVNFTKQVMDTLGFDKVYLQEVMVPHWVRGKKEIARVNSKKRGDVSLDICALGNTIGTGPAGITAEIVIVDSFDALAKLGKKGVKGKIVFFNVPMNQQYYYTFRAYSDAVKYRVNGASEAAQYGAVAVVVRSLSTAEDDFPHTGTCQYKEGTTPIPANAISVKSALLLAEILKVEPNLRLYLESHCQMLPDVLSYNVVGEITGSERPNEYIIVGGHLDAWDLGDGAHDDGAGCVQSIEALHLLTKLGIQPKHSIRVVMFINEENGLRGGKKYAEIAQEKGENHLIAIESDAGGCTPQAFSVDAPEKQYFQQVKAVASFLRPYGMQIIKDGGCADISPLKPQGTTLIGLRCDSQRYFDYHHSAADTFDKVNKRELHLGAAAMASLVYLLDTNW